MQTLRDRCVVVEQKDFASVTGNIGAEVLSSHCVVLLMELVTRNAVEDLLPEGKMGLEPITLYVYKIIKKIGICH